MQTTKTDTESLLHSALLNFKFIYTGYSSQKLTEECNYIIHLAFEVLICKECYFQKL